MQPLRDDKKKASVPKRRGPTIEYKLWMTFACASTTQVNTHHSATTHALHRHSMRLFANPSLCPSSFTRGLSSRSSLCTNLRGNWFMIEPRIQTRPIYILICRRSQFTTDRDVALLCHRRCCDEIHRNRRGLVCSWSTLFTAATRWPSFPVLGTIIRPQSIRTIITFFCLQNNSYDTRNITRRILQGTFFVINKRLRRVAPFQLIFVHSRLLRFSHFSLLMVRKLSRSTTAPCILISLRCSRVKCLPVVGNASPSRAVGTDTREDFAPPLTRALCVTADTLFPRTWQKYYDHVDLSSSNIVLINCWLIHRPSV